jgi:RNA recognition motif-containing protein
LQYLVLKKGDNFMKLFVGGLSWNTKDDLLEKAFAQFGKVLSANVVLDKETRRSRGFGFVEMENKEEATEAMNKLNNSELDGRAIFVSEAKARE